MPTYEYTCPSCGHEEDIWCKASIRKDQICSECGTATKQVIRTPAQPHWTSLAMGDSAGPEAIKRFDKMRRDKKAKEEKAIREHGSIK
jgi:putative FmdB family regulatory protein